MSYKVAQPLGLQIVLRAIKRAPILLILGEAKGRYDLEKKGDSLLMSKIVVSLTQLTNNGNGDKVNTSFEIAKFAFD